jgi:hypothetical protein
MPKILLAPCYGNRKSRQRFQDTIEGWVPFASEKLAHLLTENESAGLNERHPEGSAHFWGAVAHHDKMMADLEPGDIVLFTGDNKIKASGEVGFRFHNRAFADELWRYEGDKDSFVHVYSVVNVKPIERPKSDLWELDGFTHGDQIAGQRFVTGDRVPRVLRAFGISTSVAEAQLEKMVEKHLEQLRGSRIIPVEKAHKKQVTRTITASTTVTERVESALVLEYQHFSGADRFQSFITGGGLRADLYREEDEVEVIEAKSLATHGKVREAVAQLLDYAAHSPRPVSRLTGLFPREPDQDGLDYLHRLGIDCVHLDEDGTFTRKPASDARREYMLPVWRNT